MAAHLVKRHADTYDKCMGKLKKDLSKRGILLSLLILLQTYAIIAFAPSGLYKLLHNDPTIVNGAEPYYLIALEYIFAATFLMTTFFLLVGVLLWSKRMAVFFLVFTFIVVIFEFLLHRQSIGILPTLALPVLWLIAVLRKWSYFR
jgi:hypothetical protein